MIRYFQSLTLRVIVILIFITVNNITYYLHLQDITKENL